MFMVLVVSLLGASLATVGRTETMSSLNYKTMSQARYAAESGLHSAANYLIHVYEPPGALGGEAYPGLYDVTKSPVLYNNAPVVLTTVEGQQSNYPVEAKITKFKEDAYGPLQMSSSHTTFSATATLLSMRQFPDAYSGGNVTIQTWQITGVGTINGAGAAAVQVSAIIETQVVPAFRYAAFANKNGCNALSFGGKGSTDSYNSTTPLAAGASPVTDPSNGNVGTNGNLDENGGSDTIINGTLSTPRGGVGTCTTNNVTALTIKGKASVKDGLVKLPQEVKWKTPAEISPAPPLTDSDLKKTGCPGIVLGVNLSPFCANGAAVAGVTPLIFTPTTSQTVVSMGDVSINAGAVIHLNAGIYEINSLKVNGNADIIVDSGPVVIRVAGKADDGSELATPIDLTGGAVTNTSFKPENLQVIYGGTGNVILNGGSKTSMLAYAPNATVTLNGGGDLYGAVVGNTIIDTGGTKLHYDVNLGSWAYTEGSPTMTSFTWSSSN